MAKRKPKPLAVEDAVAAIKKLFTRKRGAWDSTEWKQRREIAEGLPAGVPPASLAKLLSVFDVSQLDELPAHADDAILAALEARRKHEDAAFVLTALAAAKGDRHERLRDLLSRTGSMLWASSVNRKGLHALVADRPDIVEGARAAVAIEGVHVTSRYLPVLVADASRESLDILVPYLEKRLKKKDHDLDWFRKEVVPLFGDTPHAKAIIAMLAEATEERTKVSPALQFAKQLGIAKPPPIVTVTLTFRDRGDRTVWQINIDSRRASWFQFRRNEKWLWRSGTPSTMEELPEARESYVLRVGKGMDRAKVDAWAKSLMP
jgi:hypothetical protein